MTTYKEYTLEVLKYKTVIWKDGKYINTVDSLSSAKYVIDNNLI